MSPYIQPRAHRQQPQQHAFLNPIEEMMRRRTLAMSSLLFPSSSSNSDHQSKNRELLINSNQTSEEQSTAVHPIFAVSPTQGITYSWISPPKALPRKRTVFTRRQRSDLESKFQAQKYISKSERIRFARELGLKDSQVTNNERKWEFHVKVCND